MSLADLCEGWASLTHNLLLTVLWARDQVDCFHVSDVHFVTEDVGKDDL